MYHCSDCGQIEEEEEDKIKEKMTKTSESLQNGFKRYQTFQDGNDNKKEQANNNQYYIY